jgi:hypothetical protein
LAIAAIAFGTASVATRRAGGVPRPDGVTIIVTITADEYRIGGTGYRCAKRSRDQRPIGDNARSTRSARQLTYGLTLTSGIGDQAQDEIFGRHQPYHHQRPRLDYRASGRHSIFDVGDATDGPATAISLSRRDHQQ